ncbi:unnamed protein product [Bathycoccus prasinos]
MRRKNPHPKRAVNARTVLVVKGARDKEEVEEEPVVFVCSRIPDDLEANHHQIQKEEEEEGEENDDDVEQLRRILMCVPCDDGVEQKQTRKDAKGVKRKRGHECEVCEKVFGSQTDLARHMRTHTNEKPYECDAVVSEDKTDDTSVLLPDEVKDLKLRDIISLWITQILQTYGDKPSSDNAPIVEGEIDDLVGGPIFLALYPYFRKYGGVFKLAFGPKVFMVLSDPVVVKEVLKEKPFSFDKGVLAEILEPIMGQGLIPGAV